MPKQIIRNRILPTALMVWGGYWLVAPLLNRAFLFDLLSSLVISAGLGMWVMFGLACIETIRLPRDEIDGGNFLILCIWTFVTAIMGRQAWGHAWRYLGRPEWMPDALTNGFLIYMMLTAIVLGLMSKDAIKGRVPPEGYRLLGIIVAIAFSIAAIVVIVFDPFPALRPWCDQWNIPTCRTDKDDRGEVVEPSGFLSSGYTFGEPLRASHGERQPHSWTEDLP